MDTVGPPPDSGFTLVELLVSIVLTGLIGSVMLGGVVRSLQVTAVATTRVEALTDMQRAIERVSRNLRAADPIDAASATSITMTVLDEVTRRRVVYTVAGGQLTQTVTVFADHTTTAGGVTQTSVVIDDLDLTGLAVFAFVAGDGTPWTAADPVTDIARVQITLSHLLAAAPSVELTSSVFVRNTLEG